MQFSCNVKSVDREYELIYHDAYDHYNAAVAFRYDRILLCEHINAEHKIDRGYQQQTSHQFYYDRPEPGTGEEQDDGVGHEHA